MIDIVYPNPTTEQVYAYEITPVADTSPIHWRIVATRDGLPWFTGYAGTPTGALELAIAHMRAVVQYAA